MGIVNNFGLKMEKIVFKRKIMKNSKAKIDTINKDTAFFLGNKYSVTSNKIEV